MYGRLLISVRPGFSPHEVHSKNTFFGWILPTLRTSEFTVLQIVGLDAAVVSPAYIQKCEPSDADHVVLQSF